MNVVLQQLLASLCRLAINPGPNELKPVCDVVLIVEQLCAILTLACRSVVVRLHRRLHLLLRGRRNGVRVLRRRHHPQRVHGDGGSAMMKRKRASR